jgi:hypothetical protein
VTNVLEYQPRRMSESEFERERAKLRETYGETAKEAAAKRDQALAALFHRSGWTQEELAKKEAKPQSWISRRLRFGAFLNFMPNGINAENLPNNLTEGKFRSYWDRTEGSNERQRFADVQRLMAEDLNLHRAARPSIVAALVEHFADGKWHSVEVIAKRLDTTLEHVKDTLSFMNKREGAKATAESKQVGKSTSYRIFPKTRMISSEELTTKLGPLIKDLKAEGKKNMATMSPSTVAHLAGLLEQILDTWTKEPH